MNHLKIPSLVLASASPRRLELLRQIGIEPQVLPVQVEEIPRPHESPADYVRRVALDKALAAAERRPEAPVLGADTEVVADGAVFGKPSDAEDCARMLRHLSGRVHRVLSAVALLWKGRRYQAMSTTLVHFRPLGEAEIAAYWASGEPAGKAGGYAIQGRGAVFVRRIEGSYSGVVGLPLCETAELLHLAGWFCMEGQIFEPSGTYWP